MPTKEQHGERFPRYFPRCTRGGWLICDHRKTEPVWHAGSKHAGQQQGKRLHEDPIPDRETADVIARGLNNGTLSPEDLAET